jgi:hypothetical protein
LVEKKAAPAAKAITSLDVIAKSEGAGEGEAADEGTEIDSKLLRKSQDTSTSKADQRCNQRFLSKGGDIKGISHLLK